jgi:putative ABC transport system permease protein
MNLVTIVRKNLAKRLLSTSLTILSVGLGVSMVIAVMVVQQETEKSFNQTSVGYDLIFAAKGSQLQATLNTLYHLETSTGIIPYSLYEAAKADPRVERVFPKYVGDSYSGFRVVGTSYDFLEQAEPRRGLPFQIADGRFFDSPLEAVLGSEVARRLNHRVGDQIFITHGLSEPAPGAEAHVHDDVPVTIVGILRPSGTANDRVLFTDLYTTHALHDPFFHLHDNDDDHEHDHDHDHSSHNHEQSHENHNHDHGHGHEDHGHEHNHDNGHGHDEQNAHTHDHDIVAESIDIRSMIELKEIDALLVKFTNPAAALQVAGLINFPTPDNPLLARNMMRDPFFRYKDQIMAVVPAMQIASLMSIVGNAEQVLRLVAWFVVIVALFGVLIAIYNTMEERKRDLAIMRALGARRFTVTIIILLESAAICLFGALAGLAGGHLIVHFSSPMLAEIAGIVIHGFNVGTDQILLVSLTVLAGILTGIIPALKAYSTDAVGNLSAGK